MVSSLHWPQVKKSSFWSVIFSYSMEQQQTISLLDCDVQKLDFIWQLAMTNSAQWFGWEEAPKHFPKLKLASENGHGHCLVICCQSNPLQFSESWWNHYIWEVCSENQWDTPKTAMPAASIAQQKGPNCPVLFHNNTYPHIVQPALQKFNELGYEVLLHLPYSPDLSPTNFHFFKHLNNFL